MKRDCVSIHSNKGESEMSNILVISTSLRAKSNSDILTERLIAGATDAGHQVEHISLKGKNLQFCRGCLACQKTRKCVLKDDANLIAEKALAADTLVFVTPIYYYEMSAAASTIPARLRVSPKRRKEPMTMGGVCADQRGWIYRHS